MKTFARAKVVLARKMKPVVDTMMTKVENVIALEYEGMSYRGLRAEAKAKAIFRYWKMDKEELKEALIQS